MKLLLTIAIAKSTVFDMGSWRGWSRWSTFTPWSKPHWRSRVRVPAQERAPNPRNFGPSRTVSSATFSGRHSNPSRWKQSLWINQPTRQSRSLRKSKLDRFVEKKCIRHICGVFLLDEGLAWIDPTKKLKVILYLIIGRLRIRFVELLYHLC